MFWYFSPSNSTTSTTMVSVSTNIFTSPLKKYKTIAMFYGNVCKTLCEFDDGNYGIWLSTPTEQKWVESSGHAIFTREEMRNFGWETCLSNTPIWVAAKVPTIPKCDCGCDKVYGKNNRVHAEYCSKYHLTK